MFKKGIIAWNKGKKWSKIIRKKISISTKGRIAWNKNIPHSEETKNKISIANKGRKWKLSKYTKIKQSISKKAEKNPNWKGDNITYSSLHNWIVRNYGKPKKCSHCSTTNAKKFEWANKSGKYLRNINDYIRLCVSCHRKYDNKKNHKFNLKKEG